MLTNTNVPASSRPAGLPERELEGDLSFLRKRWWVYAIIGLTILIIGKLVSKGPTLELFNRPVRGALLIAGAFGMLITSLVNVNLVLLFAVLYLPFVDAIPGRFGGGLTAVNLLNLFFTLLFFGWFVDKVKKKSGFIQATMTARLAALFLLFSVVSYVSNGFVFGTYYLIDQLFSLKRWADPALFFFITAGLVNKREHRRDVVIAALLGTAMTIFLSVKDLGTITHYDESRRLTGPGDQANMLGAFTVDYMFMFLGLLLVNIRKKIFWLASIPFWWGLRTVLFTFSRGAYLSFAVATLVCSALRNKVLFFICVALFFFIAVNQWVLPQSVQERIAMTVKGQTLYGYNVEFESSASARVDAWKAVAALVGSKPLLGYGIGTAGSYLAFYVGIPIGDVHNSYLLMAVEEGLIVLGIFIVLILSCLRSTFFVYKHSNDLILKGAALGFFAGIVGLSVNCFFGSHMTTLWEIGYFWVLLAVFSIEERALRDEIASLGST
jgi:hypothetical protein